MPLWSEAITRCFLLSLSFVTLVGILPAAAIPRDAEKPLYFPVEVGTKWIYDENGEEGFGCVITASEKKIGRYIVTVKCTSTDWKDLDYDTINCYEVSEVGLFSVTPGQEEPDTKKECPRWGLLKLPYKQGEKWRACEKDEKSEKVTGMIETVTVPAGTFETIRVDQGENVSFWYARGVGLVKNRMHKIRHEMRSFTPPDAKKK